MMDVKAWDSAEVLAGDGVRFLVSCHGPRLLLEANAAFTELTELSPIRYRGVGLEILFCDGTNVDLLEEALEGAENGSESECGIALTRHRSLLHIRCFSTVHRTHGACILCIAVDVVRPAATSTAALIVPAAPFEVLDATEDWKTLFGYSQEEFTSGGLDLLCGPSSNYEQMGQLCEALRICVPREFVLVAHRKDGAHALFFFRILPMFGAFNVESGGVIILLEANLLTAFTHDKANSDWDASCIESMVKNLSLAEPDIFDHQEQQRHHTSHHQIPAIRDAAAASTAYRDYSEVIFLPPAWAPELCEQLLAEMREEGLILHWAWLRAGWVRVWGRFDEIRRRAARAAPCESCMRCLWLLSLTRLSPAAAAATAVGAGSLEAQGCAAAANAAAGVGVAGAAAALSEVGTDFGFLAPVSVR